MRLLRFLILVLLSSLVWPTGQIEAQPRPSKSERITEIEQQIAVLRGRIAKLEAEAIKEDGDSKEKLNRLAKFSAQPSTTAEANLKLPGRYVHVALYTFKPDAPKGTVAAFATDADKCFQLIPSVRGYRVAPPAERGAPAAWSVQPSGDYHVGV